MEPMDKEQRALRKKMNKKTVKMTCMLSQPYFDFLETLQYDKDLSNVSEAFRYIVRDYAKRHKALDQLEFSRTGNLFRMEEINKEGSKKKKT